MDAFDGVPRPRTPLDETTSTDLQWDTPTRVRVKYSYEFGRSIMDQPKSSISEIAEETGVPIESVEQILREPVRRPRKLRDRPCNHIYDKCLAKECKHDCCYKLSELELHEQSPPGMSKEDKRYVACNALLNQ